MKKMITAMFLSAIMLLCGCGTIIPEAPSVSALVGHETAAETAAPSVTPSASITPAPTPDQSFNIPRETKVFARPEELAPVKPLFESYLKGNDMLAFAVSAVFKGDVYIMGFIYENDEWELPFNRVIGLKQNGTVVEEAFVSDKYDNPEGWIPENFTFLEWDETFYDTQAFDYNRMTVVLTKEALNEDEAMYNVFVINDKGLLYNYVCLYPCKLFEHQEKLLNGSYTWYEFAIKVEKVKLKEITDFRPYYPDIKEDDFVITVKDYKDATYEYKIHDDKSMEIIFI